MAKDPVNLDPIDVPDPNAPPQPAPQPAPANNQAQPPQPAPQPAQANNQAQPPQPVARPLIARIRGLSMTNWLIAGLIIVVLVGLVINFKKTPSETTKPPAADLQAKVTELKNEVEKADKEKALKDEIKRLEKELREKAVEPEPDTPIGPTPVEPTKPVAVSAPATPAPVALKPIIRPRVIRKVAPQATVDPSESLYSLPRLPKIRKGDLSMEDLAAEVSRFTGAAVPALVSYKNEEEAVATDNRVGWLVATMCSNAPADRRVKAAQELSYHPSKGVAQALSFTIGGGRLRTLDQFASVREAATISLGEVGDITFLPLLVQRSKDDPSPEVRKAAYDAAEKIKARASE